MANYTPLSPFPRFLHYYLSYVPAMGWLVARLLRIPAALYSVSGKTFSAHLTWDTLGFWIAVPMTAGLTLLGTKPLLQLAFFSYRQGDTRVVLFGHDFGDRDEITICIAAIFLGVVLWIRRLPDLIGTGLSLLPPLLFVLGAAYLCAVYARTLWGRRKVKISSEEFRFLMGLSTQSTALATPGISTAEADILKAARPRLNFQAVHGMSALKSRLLQAATPVIRRSKSDRSDPRNGILLFGDPGNGKTFIAEALAGELGVTFLVLDYAKVVSQYVGATSQNIARAFEQARAAGPAVLFIDEVDSFITDRDSATRNTTEGVDIVNLLLTELVNIRSYPVVVLAATNRLGKLDGAAIREGRFDFKIEIPAPDEEARLGLLSDALERHLARVSSVQRIDREAVRSAASRWSGFSVKRILAVAEEMPAYLQDYPSQVVGYEQLAGALRRIQGTKGVVPADTKPFEALVLAPSTRSAIDLIAQRMADPLRIEQLGGTLPGGILFHGPAGTGKTAAVRALAKKTGWAFLSVAGSDLLADTAKLEKLYAQARDLRPAIIFIDEADDLLQTRQFSQTSALTNKLLTLMDGAAERTKDIVWIAATNNPEQVDPALLRAGRFTEKVPFLATDARSARTLVVQWLTDRKVRLAPATSVQAVCRLLQGQSPANIEGALQHAWNLAIAQETHESVALSLEHVAQAVEVIAPAAWT
jgi:transitional endoplasmic reticulum ATPase